MTPQIGVIADTMGTSTPMTIPPSMAESVGLI